MRLSAAVLCCLISTCWLKAAELAELPQVTPQDRQAPQRDWLLHPADEATKARALRGMHANELVLTNGLVSRTFRLAPNAATVALDDLRTGKSLLRAVRPEAIVQLNGQDYPVGGLVGQPVQNFLLPEWLEQLTTPDNAFRFERFELGPTQERFPWKRRPSWMSADLPWPAPGVRLSLHFTAAPQAPEALRDVSITIYYELYDHLPLFSKWMTIENRSTAPITINKFVAEQLAVVEAESRVSEFPGPSYFTNLLPLHVETNMAFGDNMNAINDNQAVVWKTDPSYGTQVDYNLKTLCLLEVAPPIGPNVELAAGEGFTGLHVFELLMDSTERERRGLTQRAMYRAMAPWTTENPILMHVRSADPASVKAAIDQAAEVGFEMVIMTFGSGFNAESADPAYLAQLKELADYAHSKGIALGGYSLLASRSIGPEHDVINPATGQPGGIARFGHSPCLCSKWGQNYFNQLQNLFDTTGLDVLEHDGSYPGDPCASTTHPGHRNYDDSQWRQHELITNFYKRCRANGVFLNVPDWYFMTGSNKIAMGYRETNWSLPRAQQEIIERQNIYDGTWEKNASMGWMFVPLTEYHGGGAAATIEPLSQHLDHYEARMANLFGAGVQACYRGPRLFDTDETKAAVAKWVSFYKQHRAILDAPIIHGRRADGRDWDWILHASPTGAERGMLMVYNPLDEPIERELTVPLYYTGLQGAANVQSADGQVHQVAIAADGTARLPITVPARSRTWYLLKPSE